ncbi:MAG: InlB B-repeat-containing protein [Firmicutes bacterium]|nr:InlB B-repeat-containing protein [Bacillota bacterium]
MSNIKKVFAVLFAVMAVMLMNTAVWAASIGTLSNLEISDGVMTWDAYYNSSTSSYAAYYLVYVKTENGTEIIDDLSHNGSLKIEFPIANALKQYTSGEYEITIDAMKDASTLVAESKITYNFVNSKTALKTPQNVTVNNLVLSWDGYASGTPDRANCRSFSAYIYETDTNKEVAEYIFRDSTLNHYSIDLSQNAVFSADKTYYAKIQGQIDGFIKDSIDYVDSEYARSKDFNGWVKMDNIKGITNNNGVVSWDAYSKANQYIILIYNDAKYSTLIDSYTGNVTEYDVENAVTSKSYPKGVYYIKITAYGLGYDFIKYNDTDTSFREKQCQISAETKYVYTSPGMYTISFDANGGSGTMTSITSDGSPITLPDCKFTAPKGDLSGKYVFDGWYTTINGTTKFDETANITKDTVLYAHWVFNINTVRKEITAPEIDAKIDTYGYDYYYADTNGERVKFDDHSVVQLVDWGKNITTFEANGTYTATVYISNDGKIKDSIYTENTVFYINGKQAEVVNWGEKTAAVKLSFDTLKYSKIPFDTEETDTSLNGKLTLLGRALEAVGSEDFPEEYFADNYTFLWYADGSLIKTIEGIDGLSIDMDYSYSGKTIYAVLNIGGENIYSEELVIPTVIIKGDIDRDGKVTDKDAALLLKYLSGSLTTFSDAQIKASYVNDDNEINMLDVIAILNIAETA